MGTVTDTASPVLADTRFTLGISAYIALAAAALLASVPFLIPVHLFLLPTFRPEAVAFSLGLVIVAAITTGSWRADEVQVPRIAMLVALFGIVVYGESFLVVLPYRERAELWMWYLLWSAALIIAGRAIRLQVGLATLVPILATAVTIGALLSAGVGFAQWLKVSEHLWPAVASFSNMTTIEGNFGQRNLLANHLVIGIASIVYLWSIRRVGTPVLITTLMLLSVILQFAASRASLLMLAGLTISAVLWRWRSSPSNRDNVNRWLYAALLVWALIFASMELGKLAADAGVGLYASQELPSQRLAVLVDVSSTRRLWIAEQAMSMFLSSPWFGVGVGNFAWQSYWLNTVWIHSPVGGFGTEDNAHNIVLHFLAEFGLMGLVFLSVFAVMAIRGIARELRVRATPELVWASAIVLAEMLHSLVEFPLWHAHFLGLFGLVLGVTAEGHSWRPRWTMVRIILAGFALIGAGLLAVHWTAYNRLSTAIYLSSTAGATVVANDLAPIRNTLLRPYLEIGIANSFAMNRQDLDSKLEFNQRIMRFWPIYPLIHNQIILLTMAGREQEARALLDQSRRVNDEYTINLEQSLSAVSVTDIPADSWLRAAVNVKR